MTRASNIVELDEKIEYLLHEKSLILEDELKTNMEVLRKIKTKHPSYSSYSKPKSYIKKNNLIFNDKYKFTLLGILAILPLLLIPIFSSNDLNFNFIANNNHDVMKSGYVVQNLKGDTVGMFHSWNIPNGRTLYVNIVNPNVINADKIQTIKDTILSKQSVVLKNSKTTDDSQSAYYLGWNGALNQASLTPTKFTIPTSFSITEGSTNGDILIILSTLESPDGYSGFTRSTVGDNQILKSTITIYNADKLGSAELETIVRHEFGHAIGLIHSSNPDDLMHDVIETNYPLISPCNVLAVTKLYDGITNKVTCDI
ncbi:MAG: matrixin family metalloprotease [Nitrosarchaeum sp.]